MSRKSKSMEFLQEGYSITVTGRNVQFTEAMKDYALEKISKVERFSHNIIDVNITMDIQKLEHRVDITLKVDHIKIKSQASSTDMYVSIDKAVHKIEAQLLKYRERIREHQAKGLGVIDMNVNVLRGEESDDRFDFVSESEEARQRNLVKKYRPAEIVSREVIPLKTLTYEEAIMKMELSGDVFLIFRNEATQKLNVIYRRKDANFGVIEPES